MVSDKNILLNVEGMDCNNCAMGITRHLEKKGLKNVHVNFATGEAQCELIDNWTFSEVAGEINKLGYHVVEPEKNEIDQKYFSTEKKFYFSLVFTIPLMAHMFTDLVLFHNPFFQLVLCLPVFVLSVFHFGRSAYNSIKTGVPNMDVLIFIGSTAAFFYSLAGTVMYANSHDVHQFLFYETTASIVTLVLLGNVIEQKSVRQTTSAIKDLSKNRVETAKRITAHDNHEHIDEVKYNDIKIGDILLVNTGDKVPIDGFILKGICSIDESMITGESLPAEKNENDRVIGGTILKSGSIRIKAEQVGNNTVLAKIIEMVKNAQQAKPDIQRLGDKVSAIFVPAVLAISILTFLVSYFIFPLSLSSALMHSIAILVISCPCAMGLATPTAVMVGIGRAAKRGILIKGGNTLEEFANIKNIVFDKTGTLTTGIFKLKSINIVDEKIPLQEIKNLVFTLEQHSSHPIAQSLIVELKNTAQLIKLANVVEQKGLGVSASDEQGNRFSLGSYKLVSANELKQHSLYLTRNDILIATFDIEDEIKSDAAETLAKLTSQGINVILLSGDKKEKCDALAQQLNIKTVYSEKLPDEKLKIIDDLMKQGKTAMVGDGINDAPALTKADVGISMSEATQVAIQSSQIVLLNKQQLSDLFEAYLISKHTLKTIKQNLFWAFFYNVVAIPIAAVGFLSPMIGAMSMAFSDVVVIGNSVRLRAKKLS